ncbi:MAG: glycosyltransferase [Eubacterium sp.]|nr:glycosyltransferase [Eubacterium sp.]
MLSVIIPVYNVENYIEDCLESVFGQMDSNIEVVIVNDGSADNSYAICQDIINKYKDAYSAILLNQDNQGLAAARNNGMAMAHGKYIMFLDSDDMLAEGAFVKLKQYIREFQNVELFFYDAVIKNEIEKTEVTTAQNRYSRINSVDSVVVSGREYFEKYYLYPMIVSACMCLYRTDFLKRNDFTFEAGRLHEDVFFSFQTVLSAKAVLYIPEALYIRRYRPDSIMTVEKTSKHIQDYIYAYGQCMTFIESDYGNRQISNSLYCIMCSALYYFKDVQIKDDDRVVIEQFYNDIICFYCKLSKIQKGFTFYKGLLNLFDYGKDNGFVINDNNTHCLLEVLGLHTDTEIRKCLEETIDRLYQGIFSGIPFQNEKFIIGIYGSGKHSRQLIDKYEAQNGKIKAKILFIDSKKKSFTEKYLNCDIVNITDAEKYVDIIIISSFIYHMELQRLCKKYVLKKSIDIIDFYEEEKISLF